ncbi:Hypothetical predicted protein [Cloeon dipterum]|uniref:Uncharacterized protein n=1 Tax=Cloeon dipterum TaxID=197152 RepID=A0A8S1DCN4_9INSE|nr:Hypothetical predicted protein [Cloeon dipterum]
MMRNSDLEARFWDSTTYCLYDEEAKLGVFERPKEKMEHVYSPLIPRDNVPVYRAKAKEDHGIININEIVFDAFQANHENESWSTDAISIYVLAFLSGFFFSFVFYIFIYAVAYFCNLSLTEYALLSVTILPPLLIYDFSAFIGAVPSFILCLVLYQDHLYLNYELENELTLYDLTWKWHLVNFYVICTFIVGIHKRLKNNVIPFLRRNARIMAMVDYKIFYGAGAPGLAAATASSYHAESQMLTTSIGSGLLRTISSKIFKIFISGPQLEYKVLNKGTVTASRFASFQERNYIDINFIGALLGVTLHGIAIGLVIALY